MAVDQHHTDPPAAADRRGLGALYASTAVSVTGDGVLLAAAPLLAAALTRDPVAVASVTAAGYAAWLAVGLPAGALVDRWPRRRVMVLADLARAAVLALLVALLLVDRVTVAVLVVAVFLVGVGGCFFDSAAQTVIPAVVGRDQETLTKANGRLWGFDTFGRSLAGPPLGALAFSVGRAVPFVVDALSFLVSAAFVSRLPAMRPQPTEHPPVLRAIREGVRHLVTHPELRALTLGMAGFNVGYNIAFATLVLYAQDVLGVSATGYGLLIASTAVGAIAAGWLAPKVVQGLSVRTVYGVGLAAQAAAWVLVVAVGNPWLAGVALAGLGFVSLTVTVVGGAARQRLTPDHLLGRITSATRLVGLGAAAGGALIGGFVADVAGLRAPFVVAAAVLAVCSLAFLASRRRAAV